MLTEFSFSKPITNDYYAFVYVRNRQMIGKGFLQTQNQWERLMERCYK